MLIEKPPWVLGYRFAVTADGGLLRHESVAFLFFCCQPCAVENEHAFASVPRKVNLPYLCHPIP